MKREWIRRASVYLVLVAVLGGSVWLLSSTPQDVDIVLEITDVRVRDSVPLSAVRLQVMKDGAEVCRFEAWFPEDLHPMGPPGTSIGPLKCPLPSGEFNIPMQLSYGPKELARTFEVATTLKVEKAGRVDVRVPVPVETAAP